MHLTEVSLEFVKIQFENMQVLNNYTLVGIKSPQTVNMMKYPPKKLTRIDLYK
jgi:hypothetical protein